MNLMMADPLWRPKVFLAWFGEKQCIIFIEVHMIDDLSNFLIQLATCSAEFGLATSLSLSEEKLIPPY